MGKSKFVHSYLFHWFALSFHRWLIFIANFFFELAMPVSYFCFKSLSAPLFVWVTIYKTFPLAGDLPVHITCPDFTEQLVGPILQSPAGSSTLPTARSNPTQINHQKQTLIPPLICHLPHWNFFFNPLLFRFGFKANLHCVCLCALE